MSHLASLGVPVEVVCCGRLVFAAESLTETLGRSLPAFDCSATVFCRSISLISRSIVVTTQAILRSVFEGAARRVATASWARSPAWRSSRRAAVLWSSTTGAARTEPPATRSWTTRCRCRSGLSSRPSALSVFAISP